MGNVRLKIIQPTRIIMDDEFEHVIIPGSAGDFGVSEEHTPVITTIRPGILTTFKNDNKELYAIHDGFVTVENNVIRIVCEVIEKKKEIDKNRAEESKQRAEERLNKQDSDIDYRRAETSLARAIARIQTFTEA